MSKFSSNASPVISINPSFDREPFIFGYPKKLPYSPNEKCSFCGKDSPTKRCSRCKEWYCSQICQINHWPSHKYFCVEPPPLENADGTLYIPPSLKPLRKSPTKVHFEAQNGTAERPQLKEKSAPQPLRRPLVANEEHEVSRETKRSSSDADTFPLKSNVEAIKSAKQKEAEEREKLRKALVVEKDVIAELPKEVRDKPSKNLMEAHKPKPDGDTARLTKAKEDEAREKLLKALVVEKDDVVELPKEAAKIPPKNLTEITTKATQQFDYDPTYKAALVLDKPEIVQDVYILHTESPQKIFVCLESLMEPLLDLLEMCEKYAHIDKSATSFDPSIGKLCLANSTQDGEDGWYRAACLNSTGDIHEMFFVDYGFTEKLPKTSLRAMHPKLTGAKFAANQICLEGFEDVSKADQYKKDFGEEIAKTLEIFSMTKVKVVKSDPKNGLTICRMKELKHLKPKTDSPPKDEKKPSKDMTEELQQLKPKTDSPPKDEKKPTKDLTEVPTKGDEKKISKEVPSEVIKQFDYDKTHVETLVLNKPEMVQDVAILAAESPQKIFVCPENKMELCLDLSDLCEKFANIDKNVTGFSPSMGKLCLAKSSEDGAWYRAACLKVDGDDHEMYFVDYGFVEKLSKTSLRAMHPELMEAKFLANRVCLQGFEDLSREAEYKKQFGEEIAKALELFSVTKIKVVKSDPKNGFAVCQMKELKHLKPKISKTPGEFDYDPTHKAALVSDKPEMAQEVYILHSESPQKIYVCPENKMESVLEPLTEMCEKFGNLDNNTTGFSPSMGKLCLAKSSDDGAWYRAVCLKNSGDEHEMFFVDYGFVEKLSKTSLKAIHPKLMEAQFLANHVCLEGFEDLSKEAEYKKDFGEEVSNTLEPLTMTKVKVVESNSEKGFYVVQFKELKHLKPKSSSEDETIKELMAQLAKLQGKK